MNADPSQYSRWETKALAVIEQIEKDYNVNIEVINDIGNLNQNIATDAAAGKVYANIIMAQMNDQAAFATAGYAADLRTIKNLGFDTNDWGCTVSWYVDGEHVPMGVDFTFEEHAALQPAVMIFNKDLAERYEIEDIYELVNNKEWTFEKFEEICRDITTKSNGAVKGLLTPAYGLYSFIDANEPEILTVEDGRYVYNPLSDEMINGAEFAHSLVTNGLFDLETFYAPDKSTVGSRTDSFGREHKTLFFMCGWDWFLSDVEYRLENYGIIPIPSGPDSEGWFGHLGTSYAFYFLKGDPDIEDAAAVLVAMASRLSVSTEEFVDFQYERGRIRDEESYKIVKSMMLEKAKIPDIYYPFYPYDLYEPLYDPNVSMRQFLEGSKQKIQSIVDEQYNK